MEDYVTVVSVDEVQSVSNGPRKILHKIDTEKPSEDSSFITVLSINNDTSKSSSRMHQVAVDSVQQDTPDDGIESIVVYRLPGERLGFGLKFQGGGTKTDEKTDNSLLLKSLEKVQRLFIQSCAIDSPASRAKASWGYLKEGDEIISIDGHSVAEMTRMECVRCLKESNVAIRLEVRNGDAIDHDQFEEEVHKSQINQQPPPPPPVPPRKLIKRKQGQERGSPKDEKPFTPPPDAEYYINLFSNENTNLGECESDDTGSSVSTVVDRFSICSTYSTDSDYSYNSSAGIIPSANHTNGVINNQYIINKAELAKVLKPFTMLEKEFNVDSSAKLEECMKNLEPEANNSSSLPKQSQNLYENHMVTNTFDSSFQNGNESDDHGYENIEIIKNDTPKPKPRQAPIAEHKRRSVLPVPRKMKNTKEEEAGKVEENKVVLQTEQMSSTTGKSKEHVSKIPKVSPDKLLRRAKTEGEIKFKAQNPYEDLKEQCKLFLRFESGRENLPSRCFDSENKSTFSRIPIPRSEHKQSDVEDNSDTVDFVNTVNANELKYVLRPRVLIKKQKSETDLKLGSTNTTLREPQKVIEIESSEQVPSKIAIRNISPSQIKSNISGLQSPSRNKGKLKLNLNQFSNKHDHNLNGDTKVNFSIAPMAKPMNDFDEVSVMTPIRTKSQIPILSPDANECSFKTFSKDSEKRHIILNIAPEKERKILNNTPVLSPLKTGNPVPPPTIPTLAGKSSQPSSPNKKESIQPQIRFTIQTYEGDKLENIVKSNELNHSIADHSHTTAISQTETSQVVDKSEHKPLLIEDAPKKDTHATKHVLEENGEFSVDDDYFDDGDAQKPIVVKKCIKLISEDDSNYVLSSSSSSDEDEEKVYEIEDGEKLGPPEVVDGPGPSEAYFNFSWHSNMLPTIGEVEEECSSLENHSRVIIDFANDISYKIAQQVETAATNPVGSNISNPLDVKISHQQGTENVFKCKMPGLQNISSKTDSENLIAAIENENANNMTIPAECNVKENKLAVSNVSDKIRSADEIIEINNKPHQTPSSENLQGNSAISFTENRGDGESEGGGNDLVKMSTNNETNEHIVNGTSLQNLSLNLKDSAEIVVKSDAQVSYSEYLENTGLVPNPKNTKRTSVDSLEGMPARSEEVDVTAANIENSSESVTKIESISNLEPESIDELHINLPNSLKVLPDDSRIISCNGSTATHIENRLLESSTEENLIPEEPKIKFHSTEGDNLLNETRQETAYQPSDKKCTIQSLPISGTKSILLTQAMLDAEREISKQFKITKEIGRTNDLNSRSLSSAETNKIPADSLIMSSTDHASDQTNNVVLDQESQPNCKIIDPKMNDLSSIPVKALPFESKKAQSEDIIEKGDHKTDIGEIVDDNPQSEYQYNTSASAEEILTKCNLEPPKTTIETVSNNQLVDRQSKPIERIILGVENNQTSLNDKKLSSPYKSLSHMKNTPMQNDIQAKSSEYTPAMTLHAMQSGKRQIAGEGHLDAIAVKPVPKPKLRENVQDSNLKMDKNSIQITSTPLILNDYITLSSPPTHSRLPPDGHEFPPNFSEPMITPGKSSAINEGIVTTKQGNILISDQSNTDCPPLPKSVPPPTVPRKVYRQDLIIKVDDARTPEKNEKIIRLDQSNVFTTTSPLVPSSFEASRAKSSSVNTLHNMDSYKARPSPIARKLSDWRKDEKSEKSVRDKIAMFSNDDRSDLNKTSSKTFNKSIENLLDSSCKIQPFTSSLSKKAMSVENLNDDYRPYSRTNSGFIERNQAESTLYKSDITQSYSSLPRRNISTLTRTTSFSGHDEGSRRASIANILEQRRKSMSKLRGLVIPERPSSNLETIIDLPEIKSKDSEKIKMNGFSTLQPTPKRDRFSTATRSSNTSPSIGISNGVYKSIFSPGSRTPVTAPPMSTSPFFKKAEVVLPPAKPPRTSLILTKALHTEESDSDSVFSSKVSSPPMSPRAPIQEKFTLTRTLSSETNTSIASSTASTLTSGSGSQASCSSVGSTPTVDMSRKILKSGSAESTVNRKNILASAKCRSGRDDSSSLARNRRYEDEDSTDGYDEDEIRRAPKLKQRSLSTSSNKTSSVMPAPINYKLVGKDESLVDKIVNVASYVEVTSDTDDSSRKSDSSLRKISAIFIDEERKASFKSDPNQRAQTKKPEPAKRSVAAESDDLAKWVQSEAAKNFRQKDMSLSKPTAPERANLAEKFESLHKSSAEASSPLRTPIKLKTSTAEIREKFEMRSQSGLSSSKPPSNGKTEKINTNSTYHERFSSLDSIASSSSGVSSSTQNLPSNQETPTEFGSFSSFGSNQSLITAQDIQVLIEEADPPLKTPDACIVVLQRETPESSVGITLAGGSDYEAKEITIHKILGHSPAAKDGRLKKGDRILAINGLSMRGLTHRESITVLKTPRPEVVLVVTRSESVIVKPFSKKRSSLGSLTSLNDKPTETDLDKKLSYHKASRSLDLDLDIVSTEEANRPNRSSMTPAKKTGDEDIISMNGNVSSSTEILPQRKIGGIQALTRGTTTPAISKTNSSEIGDRAREPVRLISMEAQNGVFINDEEVPAGAREIEILKDNCGLGFSIEGGYDSPLGNRPLVVKKVFWGGAAQKAGSIKSGDEIICINGVMTSRMTRVDVWNYMKQIPMGPVKIILL